MGKIFRKGFVVLLVVMALPFVSFADGETKVQTITAEAFLAKVKQQPKLNLMDVRNPEEFAEVKMAGAVNVPLPTLNSNEDLQNALKPFGASKEAVYVLCRSGRRSRVAAEKFLAAGHKNLVVVEGGMNRLEELGVQVEKKGAR